MYNSRPTIFEHFVKACIANNGGVIDEDEEAVTAKLGGLIKYLSGGSLRADFSPSFFFYHGCRIVPRPAQDIGGPARVCEAE
jgi:hypothetical protein